MDKPQKRKRGTILTTSGWDKLQQAGVMFSDVGDRYTFEFLGEQTQLDSRTVAKILGRQQGVDVRSLHHFFEHFDLTLEKQDYTRSASAPVSQTPISNECSRGLEHPSQSPIVQFPSGPVPLFSKQYIERPPIERLAYAELEKPGSLIRIKAPRGMGKSSLLLRVLEHAQQHKYHTVCIDFLQADQAILEDASLFLRWLCSNIALQLGLDPRLDEYWDSEIGLKVSCTLYLQAYLLPQLEGPLVLAFNEVNRIFEHSNLSIDFFPLLRFWHEQAKQVTCFQNLRLIVVHSTEVYVPLQVNHSPFNVGLTIQLPEFNLEQICSLAQRYGLGWSNDDSAKQLMDWVGGHPFLVCLALYHLAVGEMTLEQILQDAATPSGIYHNHLLSQWNTLQSEPKLADAFRQVTVSPAKIQMQPLLAHKLNSMGLVILEGNAVRSSCKLYRRYFSTQYFAAHGSV